MRAADESYWDHRVLLPAPTAHRLQLGERSALFCARRQQLYELNPTADAIWQAIASEREPGAAADALSRDADRTQVLDFVRQAVSAWMRGGQLVPAEILSLKAHDELDFVLDELRLTIRVCGEAAAQPIMSVFGQFAGEGGAGRPITVAGLGCLIFMLDGDQPLGAWDERGWIAELKARITELYAQAATSGFLAHAALLSRDGGGLLVCGEPGDGKTTLSIALAAHGFGHHADDIVRIDETGHATGAPFAPALKSGAWTLLGEIVPGLDDLPIYLRGDGQEVRYLPVAAAIRPSLPIGAVLLLNRQSGGPAAIEPVEPMQVLTAILGSAYSPRGAIDAQTLQALADAVNGARLGRLTYAGLDEAVRAVDAFFR